VYLPVDHERVRFVDRDIFFVAFVGNCMAHGCLCRDEGDRLELDACCQHGADVQIPETKAILKKTREIASVLKPAWRNPRTWFDDREPAHDPAVPGGLWIRTATTNPDDDASGCVFLEHTGTRGCGLHLAALTHGFDPADVKPEVCQTYPLYLDDGRLAFSDDFDRYSCARTGSDTVYEVMRPTLARLYGSDAVEAIDAVEKRVRPAALRVLAR
jgi:Fe-S-cluster containining protein